MRVLHVTQHLSAGVASYLSEIIPTQIRRLGSENLLVLAAVGDLDNAGSLPEVSRRSFGSSRRNLRALLRLAIMARQVIRQDRPDIIHLHSSFAGALVRATYLFTPSSNRPKIIYCAHGWSFNMRLPRVLRWLLGVVERILARRADAIVCISRFEYTTALDRGLPKNKLHLIYNGIDANVTQPIRSNVLRARGRINILFIGRMDRQKGYDILHAALAKLRNNDVHLHVVGATILSGSTDRIADSPNITTYGWRPRNEIPSFIHACDAVIIPSRWEGFGIVAVEAMRQSRAVLASSVDALPELVCDQATGLLFDINNLDGLIQMLGELDPVQLRMMGAEGRKRFLSLFTAERLNKELLSLYESVHTKDIVSC